MTVEIRHDCWKKKKRERENTKRKIKITPRDSISMKNFPLFDFQHTHINIHMNRQVEFCEYLSIFKTKVRQL